MVALHLACVSSWGCTDHSTDALAWLPAQTAYRECQTVGVALPVAGWAPRHFPRGLYLGDFSAPSASLVGFREKTPICAALLIDRKPPDRRATEELAAHLQAVQSQWPSLGECACRWAFDDRLIGLIPACDRVSPSACASKTPPSLAYQQAMTPVQSNLRAAFIAPRHWRVVGQTQRSKTFHETAPRLIQSFAGTSDVHLREPGLHRPSSGNRRGQAEIERLLHVRHVIAVVRQNHGSGYLVVRETPQAVLILDHFESRVSGRAGDDIGRVWEPLMVDWIVHALDAPPPHEPAAALSNRTWRWQLDVALTQNQNELDHLADALSGAKLSPPAAALRPFDHLSGGITTEMPQALTFELDLAQNFAAGLNAALASDDPAKRTPWMVVTNEHEPAVRERKNLHRPTGASAPRPIEAVALATWLSETLPAKVERTAETAIRWTITDAGDPLKSPLAALLAANGLRANAASVAEVRFDPASRHLSLSFALPQVRQTAP